jgi:ElaB/YqjD/DUF883 family membrane-anchored ribosome-binding protein
MNTTNGDFGGTVNTDQVADRLRAAKESAAEGARARAQQAQDWARNQWSELQDRVEAEPYKASAWALGVGFLAGILLMSLLRGGSRD